MLVKIRRFHSCDTKAVKAAKRGRSKRSVDSPDARRIVRVHVDELALAVAGDVAPHAASHTPNVALHTVRTKANTKKLERRRTQKVRTKANIQVTTKAKSSTASTRRAKFRTTAKIKFSTKAKS